MKKSKAIVLGIFTIIPVLYLVFFITFFVGMLFKAFGGANPNPPVNLLLLIFPIHFLMMILLIVLLMIYIVNVFNNTSVEPDKRSLWAIVLIFGSIIAMIVYWIVHIWKPICNENKNISVDLNKKIEHVE